MAFFSPATDANCHDNNIPDGRGKRTPFVHDRYAI